MPDALPPLDSLHVLAACVRHGSFSRAARELCITPSAVSLRMRTLEAQLGIALFERRGPRLIVTEQGRQLAATAEDAVAALRGALDRARRVRRALRVTCAPAFASRWLVPRLAAYQALPDAEPIALDASESVLPAHRFDVAIRSSIDAPSDVASLELLPDQGTPMFAPALLGATARRGTRALSPRRLLELPLLPDERWPAWFALAGLAGAAPRHAPSRFASYELEAAAASAGVGVALLSPVLYAELLARGSLIAPFRWIVDGPRRYRALWDPARPAPHFVQWLERELRARPR
jgi:LysR family transcriptional regulator, glycine cleavage system transcriptional activator